MPHRLTTLRKTDARWKKETTTKQNSSRAYDFFVCQPFKYQTWIFWNDSSSHGAFTSPLKNENIINVSMLKAYQSMHVSFNGCYIPSTDTMMVVIFPAKCFILIIIFRSRNLGYTKETQIINNSCIYIFADFKVKVKKIYLIRFLSLCPSYSSERGFTYSCD